MRLGAALPQAVTGSQSSSYKWGFISEVREGAGSPEINAEEGRLLPQVGRAPRGGQRTEGWSVAGRSCPSTESLSSALSQPFPRHGWGPGAPTPDRVAAGGLGGGDGLRRVQWLQPRAEQSRAKQSRAPEARALPSQVGGKHLPRCPAPSGQFLCCFLSGKGPVW